MGELTALLKEVMTDEELEAIRGGLAAMLSVLVKSLGVAGMKNLQTPAATVEAAPATKTAAETKTPVAMETAAQAAEEPSTPVVQEICPQCNQVEGHKAGCTNATA